MNIKYILRPKGILTTPRILKENLDAQYLTTGRVPTDPRRTFFLKYPYFSLSLPSNYQILSSFYSKNKYLQRKEIGLRGVHVPQSAAYGEDTSDLQDLGYGFVCRPFRHRGGIGWRTVESPSECLPGEYVSPIFPKYREYRVIYVLGSPVIVLRKRSTEQRDPRSPWNHQQGSTFITVENPENDHTLRTSLREDLEQLDIIKMSDIVGVDVMLDRDNNYQGCEFNTCPALTIENNIRKVVDHVQVSFQLHRDEFYV